ncbi:hypothetical protein GBA52_013604 [Prunus armeniaca]|nr:hypothetical protein GBA52_013604 [Prunus armeniaca]
MASLLAENWSCMNNNMDMNDHFPGAAGAGTSSNMSNALLMSLLEETQGDQDHDEERLRSLIRALEVELDPTTSEDHEIFMENPHQFGGISQEDFHPLDVGYVSGGDFPGTDAAGFGWIDMEIGSSSQEGTGESVDWYMILVLMMRSIARLVILEGLRPLPLRKMGFRICGRKHILIQG